MFTGDVNTGAYGDIRQATGIARHMVRDWGMNDRLGFVYYGEDDSTPGMFGDFGGGREYSEETAKAIDEEVKKLIDGLYEETRQLLDGQQGPRRSDRQGPDAVRDAGQLGRRPHHARRQADQADGRRPSGARDRTAVPR